MIQFGTNVPETAHMECLQDASVAILDAIHAVEMIPHDLRPSGVLDLLIEARGALRNEWNCLTQPKS